MTTPQGDAASAPPISRPRTKKPTTLFHNKKPKVVPPPKQQQQQAQVKKQQSTASPTPPPSQALRRSQTPSQPSSQSQQQLNGSASNASLLSTSSTSSSNLGVPASTSTSTGPSAGLGSAPPPPDLPFQDFKLMSCARHGWRYDVMKFDARKPVDLTTWPLPIKLNRKEPVRLASAGDAAAAVGSSTSSSPMPVAVGPMLGPDGKPVIGADGRVVMVDAEGKPIHDTSGYSARKGGSGVLSASGSMSSIDGKDGNSKSANTTNNNNNNNNKKKKFQKKTRQVFLVPEHIRQLRREERFPWVIEDGTGSEVWVGRMEEQAKSETHALFMPAADNIFRFVPAHRWYKFQKRRPQGHVMSLEEAEKIMENKSKMEGRWAMRARANLVGADGAAAGQSGGFGGGGAARGGGLRLVDSGGQSKVEEDDEEGEGGRRRRERELGAEGDLDEVEYDEGKSDDEEAPPQEDGEDELTKEIEERLKREYRNANKLRENYVDESEEEDEGHELSGAGKAMKKLVRKIDKNNAYDSDEDENPYASSEEEEEEEEPPTQAAGEPAVLQQQTQPRSRSASQAPSQAKPGAGTGTGTPRPSSKAPSRAGSPAPGTSANSPITVKTEASPAPPTMGAGGHSVLAKRATSPKVPSAPKYKKGGNSRAASPLAGSRAGSPTPNSPTTPTTGGASANAGKPPKRKAEDGASGTGGASNPKQKKRKPAPSTSNTATAGASSSTAGAGGAGASGGGGAKPTIAPGTTLTPALLIAWLRATPNAMTRECIQYFQPALSDEATKKNFTALVKQLVTMKDGVLILKPPYREGNPESIVV